MMELWRYTYNFRGRWYEAYCYLTLGETVEAAHARITLNLDPEVRELQVRRIGHVTSMAGCGPSKRIPKSYTINAQ
jgi:hypothetical protein